jgi:hypothetical protein
MDPQTDMDLCCLIDSKPGEASPNRNPSQFVLRAAQLLERETKFVVKPLPNASESLVIWLNTLGICCRPGRLQPRGRLVTGASIRGLDSIQMSYRTLPLFPLPPLRLTSHLGLSPTD